jgi:hypothetical protein
MSLKRAHPNLNIWKEDLVGNQSTPRWYNDLRNQIERVMAKRARDNGDKLVEKSEPIGRNLLKKNMHCST